MYDNYESLFVSKEQSNLSQPKMSEMCAISIGDFVFEFEEWIKKHRLTSIRQVFLDNNMSTAPAINFHENFSKLIADHRIVSNPDIIPQIMAAIQQHQGLYNQSVPVLSVSDTEHTALTDIKKCIQNLKALRVHLSQIRDQYILKKDHNQQQIRNYIQRIQICNSDLIQQNKRITDIFNDARKQLDAKEPLLLHKTDKVRKEFDKHYIHHQQRTDALDLTLRATESAIMDDLNYIKEQHMFCKDTLRDYNKYLSERSNLTQKREDKIAKIAKHTKQCYTAGIEKINKNMNQIEEFIKNDIHFDINITSEKFKKSWCVALKPGILNRFKRDINSAVDSICVNEQNEDRKQRKKENEKNETNLKKQIDSLKEKLTDANEIIVKLRKLNVSEATKLNNKIQDLERKIAVNEELKTK